MSIFWFHEVGAGDIERVGGKGANLGEMTRAGFPVPRGFCINADTYRRVIDEAGLWPAIQRRLGAASNNQASIEEAAAEIRALIEAAPVPPDVVERVRRAYAELDGGGRAVAVRSSATAEDLPEASFAGQQETYLGVKGEPALLHAIRCCWASLWTGRAVSYRERNGFPHEQVSLSVVVQRMVEPETAGVLFTVNPVKRSAGELVVNAAYGLGESVVSGRVTPDSFCLGRALPLEVRERTCGTKAIRIRSVEQGGTITEEVPAGEQARFCLDDHALVALVSLGMKVEAHYGHPQDIEWAIAGGELFLLQTRPVTTLGSAADPPPRRPLSRMARRVLDDILEHYPDPPYPLDHEAVARGYEQLQLALRQGGMTAASGEAIIQLDERGLPTIDPVVPRPTFRMLWALPSFLWRQLRLDPESWRAKQEPRFVTLAKELRAIDVASLDGPALAAYISRAVDAATEVGRLRFSDYIVPMMVRGALLKLLSRLVGGGRIEWADLLGELDYRTVAIDRALENLAADALTSPAVCELLRDRPVVDVLGALNNTNEGRRFHARLDKFLDEHGARTMKVYLPFSNLSWREDPVSLLATLAVVVRAGHTGGSATRAAAADRFRRLRDKVSHRLGPLGRGFLGVLTRFREGHVAREGTLYLIEELFAVARIGMREAQQRLVDSGALPTADSVRFLTVEELREALQSERPAAELRSLIGRRRAARAGAVASWRGAEPAMVATDGDLNGQPGSPGQATGRACLISGPEEFSKLQSGDVLVCSFTDPAWTPLFSLASAVVADTGGPLSHAAIVAREYGIPAVLGTQVATSRLKDGDSLRVDGSRGIVQVVPSD